MKSHLQVVQAMQQHSDLAMNFRELKEQKDGATLSLQHYFNEYKNSVEDTDSIPENFHSRLFKVKIERDELTRHCKELKLEFRKLEEEQAAVPSTGSSATDNNTNEKHYNVGCSQDLDATEKPNRNNTNAQHLDTEQCHQGCKLLKNIGKAPGFEESVKESIGCVLGKEITPLQKMQGKLDSSKVEGASDELSEVREALDKELLKHVNLQHTLSAQQEQLNKFEKQEKELTFLLAERLQSSSDNESGPSNNALSNFLLFQDKKTAITSNGVNACFGIGGDAASVLPREEYKVDCYAKIHERSVPLQLLDERAVRNSNSSSNALVVSNVLMDVNTGNLFQHNPGKEQALCKKLLRILSLSSS